MSKSSPDKIIQNSDDDGDSDSSLEDLTALLTSKIPDVRREQVQREENLVKTSPFTIRSTRLKRSVVNNYSKETKQQYKYDLKSLAKSTQSYDAAQASSNRVKDMLESEKKVTDHNINFKKPLSECPDLTQSDLLEAIEVGHDGKGREADKIKWAIEKAGANSNPKTWYFFKFHSNSSELPRRAFPIASLSETLKCEMGNSEMRRQAFISGFVEDMVDFGETLSDDIFLWLLDEVCWQECDTMRNCYINVLTQSSSQIQRLIDPKVITEIFLHLNGTIDGINVNQKINLVDEIPDYYSNRDWSALLSIMKFFSHVAESLTQESKRQLACILLRMSVDNVVLKNVDIIDRIQKTIDCLCKCTVSWKEFCQDICENIFYFVEQPTLRLQIVESLSSKSVRSHDLRRRLASCFLFNDLKFAQKPCQYFFNFPMFLDRLKVKDFKCTSNTDYNQLRALIVLMDIAVDDGRSNHLDLANGKEEACFNSDVDNLSTTVKEILCGIGTQDSGSISQMQAKEAVEAFSRRITHTMRTKPKAVHEWFSDRGHKKNDPKEQQAMKNFLVKMITYKSAD